MRLSAAKRFVGRLEMRRKDGNSGGSEHQDRARLRAPASGSGKVLSTDACSRPCAAIHSAFQGDKEARALGRATAGTWHRCPSPRSPRRAVEIRVSRVRSGGCERSGGEDDDGAGADRGAMTGGCHESQMSQTRGARGATALLLLMLLRVLDLELRARRQRVRGSQRARRVRTRAAAKPGEGSSRRPQ